MLTTARTNAVFAALAIFSWGFEPAVSEPVSLHFSGEASDYVYFPAPNGEGFQERPTVRLTGEIQPGDSEKIISFLSVIQSATASETVESLGLPNRIVLSLDSEGGHIETALAIADYVRENDIATLVERDAMCLSSCALIFMAGRGASHELFALSSFRQRFIEVPGVVGFHSPKLTSLEFDVSGLSNNVIRMLPDVIEAQMLSAHAQASIQLADIIRSSPDDFPPSLLAEMLSVGHEAYIPTLEGPQFAYVDEVKDAIEWNIEIINIRPRVQSVDDFFDGVFWFCANSQDSVDMHGTGMFDLLENEDDMQDFSASNYISVLGSGRISVEFGPVVNCELEFLHDVDSVMVNGASLPLSHSNWIYSYPRSEKLENVANPSGSNRGGLDQEFLGCRDAECFPILKAISGIESTNSNNLSIGLDFFELVQNSSGFVVQGYGNYFSKNYQEGFDGEPLYLGVDCDALLGGVSGNWEVSDYNTRVRLGGHNITFDQPINRPPESCRE